jgi:hypothetical protein
MKRRPRSYCRGYVINAHEAAELEHVDEALTAAHVGTVAFFTVVTSSSLTLRDI